MIFTLLLQLAIAVPARERDTTDHVDLRVTQSAPLTVRHDSAWPVKWRSGNTAVASVSTKGVVLAKKRGFATITAISHGDTATTRVCVSSAPAETLAVSIASMTMAPIERLAVGAHATPAALLQLKTAGAWGSCLHWALSPRIEGVTVSRRGVLSMHYPVTHANAIAVLGPVIP